MKLGKCKQALADFINANGGWVDGEAIFAAMDGNGDLFGYSGRPQWTVSHGHWYGHTLTCWFFSPIVINNHHQTILSCEEYYQAYPKADADGWIYHNGKSNPVGEMDVVDVLFGNGQTSMSRRAGEWNWSWGGKSSANCFLIEKYRPHKPEVKPEFCESVMLSIPEPSSKPTIEQLASDYHNKLDYASRKQQEADDAKVAADAALGELERAGEALGLLIGIAKPDREPELVITDWRELKIGDEVKYIRGTTEECNGMVGTICKIDRRQECGRYRINISFGKFSRWCDRWEFIRRP